MYKLCWITDAPSPYKMEMFKCLAKYFDFTAIFVEKYNSIRDESWKNLDDGTIKTVYLYGDVLKNYKILEEFSCNNEILINSYYTNINSMMLVELFKKQKKLVFMDADGGMVVERPAIVKKIISFIMNRNQYFFSSSRITDEYFKYFGVKENKIYRYHFSSLSKRDIENNLKLREKSKEIKKELNIEERYVILSVGQQIERKGYDILTKAFVELGRNDVRLIVVGGQPLPIVQKILNENRFDNVTFVNYLEKNRLNKYFAIADIFALSTRYDIWGLVINEAMSFGLPIISSDKCVAAMEFSELFNNAIICNLNDTQCFKDSIDRLLKDGELRKMLGNNSLIGIKEYTVEKNAEDIYKIIYKIMNNYCVQRHNNTNLNERNDA